MGDTLIYEAHADAAVVRRSAPSGGHDDFEFRNPDPDDAFAISNLIASCPPLDTNSLYCNLLQCSHFAETCIVAERDNAIVGWISGHRPPSQPRSMFVWQVAVDDRARGRGLGVAMLDRLFRLPAVADAEHLLTTVTPSNQPSRRMFAAFARLFDAELRTSPGFESKRHFGGNHESEELISIGPLKPRLD